MQLMTELPKRRRKKNRPKLPDGEAPSRAKGDEQESSPVVPSNFNLLGLQSPQIPQKTLAIICRSLGTMLHSGVDPHNALRMTTDKVSDGRARDAMRNVQKAVAARGEIAEAMREQGRRFPPLMMDLVSVGEQTGSLPEVLRSLSKHYETNVRLKRDFLGSIAWPVFQMVAAILVIALLIYILGMLQTSNTPDSFHFDVFGLSGAGGSITWLFMTFGTLAGIFVTYKVMVRNLAGRQFLDPILMKIPVLGKCMRSFAIARFSWAFALTQQAGMRIEPSVTQSFKATANGAFAMGRDVAWQRLKEGESLTDSLEATRLFPDDYIHTVHVAESSGTVPEALDRLSPQFEDEAQRSLRALTAMLGWGTWAIVAIFIVYMIFNIALQYVGMLNRAASGTF